jgi:hypothetical protein
MVSGILFHMVMEETASKGLDEINTSTLRVAPLNYREFRPLSGNGPKWD